MSGNTSLVSSTPGFVTGTFGAKDVRLATMGNELPGLYERGDFAVSQRAAGANMSVDIAQGRALMLPGGSHQGLYLARRTSGTAYNTSADGGYTWTAADASNARIDLLCIEMKDTDEDAGGVTGWRFRVVDGTPSASATHQLEVGAWPAVPTGCLPIAAIRVPAAGTTLTTANITNLNPIAGARGTTSLIATAETTTSASYARLATPDVLMVYVPASGSIVRVAYKSLMKISVASGTQALSLFIDGNQIKQPVNGAAPAVVDGVSGTLAATDLNIALGHGGFSADSASSTGATDVSTGLFFGVGASGFRAMAPAEIVGLTAGWHVLEMRYKTSANTLTVNSRRFWAQVVG